MKPENNINLEKMNCVICGKSFYRNKISRSSRGARLRSFRQANTKTCSRQCSRKHLDEIRRTNARLYRLRSKIQKQSGEKVSSDPHEVESRGAIPGSAIHSRERTSKEANLTPPDKYISKRGKLK